MPRWPGPDDGAMKSEPVGRLAARMQDANDRRAQVGTRDEGAHVPGIERRGERIEIDPDRGA